MPLLRDMPINRKLTVVVVLTSGLALLLSGIAIVVADTVLYGAIIRRDLTALAQIVADNTTAALAFENTQDAEEILASLRARPSLIQACIFAQDASVFAQYRRLGESSECPQTAEADSERIVDDRLVLFRSILLDKKQLGSLYFEYQLDAIAARQKLYAALVGGIGIVSMAAAFLISSRMRRLIAEPITELAKTARAVSANKDYGIRAKKETEDELGLLVDSFNDMLTNIQERDAELRKAHNELEERVIERTAQLEAVNKELEAFTYSVAHDLRAPLRHIDAFSRILAEEAQQHLPPQSNQYLTRILQAARQMGQLVDDLLNLSRVGRKELSLQTTGLNSVVDEVLTGLRPELDGRQIEWKIGKLPFVEADPSLLRQVFTNLLSNAVKYTRPRDHAFIEVGSMPSNGTPCIFVRDNGVGFNMKYAEKLFGIFQRLHRQEDFEGTGIGLATVQRIIHKHGGRIWAEAELDKGAAFYFTLGAEEKGSEYLRIAG
jgi:signal transduction histidine kinase